MTHTVSRQSTSAPALPEIPSLDVVTPQGLRVVLLRAPGHPVAEVRLVVPLVRSDDDAAAHAEILSRLLWDDGPLGTADIVLRRLAVLGISMGTTVDPRQLALSARVPAERLVALLRLMATRLASPGTTQDAVERARGRVAALSVVAWSDAAFLARAEFLQGLGDHPARRLSATPPALGAVDQISVESFHRHRLVPRGSRLVVVAPSDPAEILPLVLEAVSIWDAPGSVAAPPPVPAHTPRSTAVVGPLGERALFRLSVPAPPRDSSGYPAARLAALIFAGPLDSPWVRTVREEHGWTYDAALSSESVADRRWDVLQANTTEASLADLLCSTVTLMRKFRQQPVTEIDVQAARRHCWGSLVMTLGDPRHLATATADLIGVGLSPAWPAEFVGAVLAVPVSEVRSAAEQLLTPEQITGSIVVGDAGSAARIVATADELLRPMRQIDRDQVTR